MSNALFHAVFKKEELSWPRTKKRFLCQEELPKLAVHWDQRKSAALILEVMDSRIVSKIKTLVFTCLLL
jgi:hypothetical protein